MCPFLIFIPLSLLSACVICVSSPALFNSVSVKTVTGLSIYPEAVMLVVTLLPDEVVHRGQLKGPLPSSSHAKFCLYNSCVRWQEKGRAISFLRVCVDPQRESKGSKGA